MIKRAVVKHAAVEADEVALFAVNIDEVYPAGKLQAIKFLPADRLTD